MSQTSDQDPLARTAVEIIFIKLDRIEDTINRVATVLNEHTTVLNGHTAVLNEILRRLPEAPR